MILNQSELLSEETIKFQSICEILNEDSLFYQPKLTEMPQSFKGMIMLTLLQKFMKSSYSGHQLSPYFIKIYAYGKRVEAIDKFLINRPISITSFFYKLKKQGRKQKRNTIFKQKHKQETNNLFVSFPNKNNTNDHKINLKLCYLLQMKHRNILKDSFHKMMSHYDIDFDEELVRAKRNLQLLQYNMQIQDEVDLIYKGYLEQIQTFQDLDTQFQKMKKCIKQNKIQTIINIYKRLHYPNLREFMMKFKDQYKIEASFRVIKDVLSRQQIQIGMSDSSIQPCSLRRIRDSKDYQFASNISNILK